MSGIENIFDIASRAMSSQMTRLNTVASNIANANSVAGSREEAYQAIKPLFETEYASHAKTSGVATVNVAGIVTANREPSKVYQPEHPKADDEGYVWGAAVDVEEEMVEMLEASRQYQNNLEVVSTLRSLMMRTVNMGR
ncbi:flagellar basal body rod protein FlgC [uncultured Lentibacter sp.]|jgi:flagellar basal-body rod protein FlgC|uniref:flagellar basal body rod protein FlgC n=1 Tax=uncultured Lentibacter sp. TaxID=1659309 RepID=UPI0026334970|nr:flagellar basal body rod protein FlgC [uncultured Lentibacter sp.]